MQFTSASCTLNGGSDCDMTWPGIQPTVFLDSATSVGSDGLTIVLKGEDSSTSADSARVLANTMEEIDTSQECECSFRESTTGIVQSYQQFGPGYMFQTSFKVDVTETNSNTSGGTTSDSVASLWLQSTEAEVAFGIRGNVITLSATAFGAGATGQPEEKEITLADGFDETQMNKFSLWWDPASNDISLYVGEERVGTIPGTWAAGDVDFGKMMLMMDLQISDMATLTEIPLQTELTVSHVSVFKGAVADPPPPAPAPSPPPSGGVACADFTNTKWAKCRDAGLGCSWSGAATKICSGSTAPPPSPAPPPSGGVSCNTLSGSGKFKDCKAAGCSWSGSATKICSGTATSPSPSPPPSGGGACGDLSGIGKYKDCKAAGCTWGKGRVCS
jgi:hypothetical protein